MKVYKRSLYTNSSYKLSKAWLHAETINKAWTVSKLAANILHFNYVDVLTVEVVGFSILETMLTFSNIILPLTSFYVNRIVTFFSLQTPKIMKLSIITLTYAVTAFLALVSGTTIVIYNFCRYTCTNVRDHGIQSTLSVCQKPGINITVKLYKWRSCKFNFQKLNN